MLACDGHISAHRYVSRHAAALISSFCIVPLHDARTTARRSSLPRPLAVSRSPRCSATRRLCAVLSARREIDCTSGQQAEKRRQDKLSLSFEARKHAFRAGKLFFWMAGVVVAPHCGSFSASRSIIQLIALYMYLSLVSNTTVFW